MADFLTRCPKCGTSFRIGLAHLNSAKGAVRCGSCLNIFSAKQNLVKNQPSRAVLPEPQRRSNSNLSASQDQDDPVFENFDDEDLLISDDMDDDEKNIEDTNFFGVADALNAYESSDQAISAQESNLFERPISDTDDNINGETGQVTDESWAINLLNNLDEEDEPVKKSVKSNGFASWNQPKKQIQPAKNRAKPQDSPKTTAKRVNGNATPLAKNAKAPAHKAAASVATAKKQEKPKAQNAKTASQQVNSEYPDYASVHEYDEKKPSPKKPVTKKTVTQKAPPRITDDAEPEIETRAEPKIDYKQGFENIDLEINEDAYPASGRFYDTSINNSYADAIEPEPVDFSYRSNYVPWKTKLPLIVGIAFTCLLLVAQVLWLNLPQFSRVEPYRGYYSSVCNVVGCTLPTMIDRDKIRATNLVVRSHPTIADALIVDAVLKNSASFPQSFPDLDLIFTDVKDKPVAARRFTPQEYLGGELAGSEEMPVGNPVHIAVEIADPGARAVSYRMSIAN